jgi:proteic killer suppression protein
MVVPRCYLASAVRTGQDRIRLAAVWIYTWWYSGNVIKTFRNKTTEQIFHRIPVPGFPPDLLRAAMRRLDALDGAATLMELAAVPGNRLHQLSGDRAGQHSISVNKQWRVCFEWTGGHAEGVEIVDCH